MSYARFSFDDLLTATQGSLVSSSTNFPQVVRIWTDTRTLSAGDFFVPLSGANFNGHDYLEAAFAQGAVGALVALEQWQANPQWQNFSGLITVKDPLEAYMALGSYHRKRLSPVVIAVTGSSGKTTTKEMLYSVLAPLMTTQKSLKNFNNEVGLTQTLLALEPDTDCLIVEMGMRGLGQIAQLSHCALPDVGIIVNVGPAHIGLLGSLEAIAQAKCELFEGMDPQKAIGVINGDDSLLVKTAKSLWQGRLEDYHLADATDIEHLPEGIAFSFEQSRIHLQVPGLHNVSNALAVLQVGQDLGIELGALIPGLEAFRGEDGRWSQEPLAVANNAWVINDAYNANPASTLAALKTLLQSSSSDLKRILVLGGMKELGEHSQGYHEALGQWLSQQERINAIYLVGEEGAWIQQGADKARYPIHLMDNAASVAHALKTENLENTLLFLKGSRSYHLEEIPALLRGESH